ncbi:MAG: transposase [Actinomycetes bacterium]
MMGKQTRRHTPEQAIGKLRDIEVLLASGKPLELVLREQQISEQTYYRWRQKYGLMTSDEAKRLKWLERENAQLKSIVADLSLQNQVLKDVASRKW